MEKKKKKNILLILTGLFFIVYMGLYISQASGYYEYKEHNKRVLTEKAMKKFESDIETGKDIKISEYININSPTYSNKVSSITYNISSAIEKVMTTGVREGFSMVGKLFA